MTLNSHTEAFEENLRVVEMLHLFSLYIYTERERERGGGEGTLNSIMKGWSICQKYRVCLDK